MLVIGEMAFSIVLLVVASLTLWGYVRLVRVDPGFKPDRLYTVIMNGLQLRDPRIDDLMDQMRKLPYIEGVARAFNINQTSRYTLEGLAKDGYRLVGNVPPSGKAPGGMLRHRGWKTKAGKIVAPAELEIE